MFNKCIRTIFKINYFKIFNFYLIYTTNKYKYNEKFGLDLIVKNIQKEIAILFAIGIKRSSVLSAERSELENLIKEIN